MKYITYFAIAGNIAYILWITYNGLNEGFAGSPVQIASYVGIVILLAIDAILLIKKNI